jgi:hypothetical protein
MGRRSDEEKGQEHGRKNEASPFSRFARID